MIEVAVVLAAGSGSRLRPLTDEVPKPLIEVGGRTLIARTLDAIAAAGIGEVTVVVGHLAAQIEDHLADTAEPAVSFVQQAEPLGSGHAVALARQSVRDGPFLLVWGDVVTDSSDYSTVATAWSPGLDAVIGVIEVEDVSEGGAVVFDDDGAVTAVLEKPRGEPPSRWNSAGIMVLGPAIWDFVEALQPSARGELEFTDALAAMIDAGAKVVAVPLQGPWFDVGTPDRLEEARLAWG